jgi:hypothetical protein
MKIHCDKMKNKSYPTAGRVPKSGKKVVDRKRKSIHP